MGSAQFQFGAVSDSLSRMRDQGKLVIRSVQMKRDGVTRVVYFVGPQVGMEDKIDAFRAWLIQEHLATKERTNFEYLFAGVFPDLVSPKDISTIAWWSLDDDITWTLNLHVAHNLLEGLRSVKR